MQGLLFTEITREWILKKMQEKSIGVYELADKMGLSRQSIEKWLNGSADPSEKNRKKLKEILE